MLQFCEGCGVLLERRRQAKFCSDACKQKAYRHRQRGLTPLADMGRYATVVIDPPWSSSGFPKSTWVEGPAVGCCRGGTSGRGHWCHKVANHEDFDYSLMKPQDIAALPVRAVLEKNAFVFLWTINRFIRDAFDLLQAWRLKYICTMAWHKPHGPKPVGYPIYNLEHILVARKGNPKFLDTKGFRTANYWEAPHNFNAAPGAWGRQIANCTKPDGFYELLRRVTPEPRLDVFARRRIEGFDRWGNESPL